MRVCILVILGICGYLAPTLLAQSPPIIDKFLRVNNSANKQQALSGDIIIFSVTVSNISENEVKSSTLVYRLPPGFSYNSGSTLLNDKRAKNPDITGGNRVLTFAIGDIAAKTSKKIQFLATVGVMAREGDCDSLAQAWGEVDGTKLASFAANATVRVHRESFLDEAWVFGHVYVDLDKNDRYDYQFDPVVPGVKIFLETGEFAITDVQGRYSIAGLSLGTHALAIDQAMLPANMKLRRKGRYDRTRFVDVKTPGPWRVDFVVDIDEEVYIPCRTRFRLEIVEDIEEHWFSGYIQEEFFAHTLLFERKTGAISELDKVILSRCLAQAPKPEKWEISVAVRRPILRSVEDELFAKLPALDAFLRHRFGLSPQNILLGWEDGEKIEIPREGPIQSNPVKTIAARISPVQVPADGKTEPAVSVELLDENDRRTVHSSFLTINAGHAILTPDASPDDDGHQIRVENGRAEFFLAPMTSPGEAKLEIVFGELKKEFTVPYVPYSEDWIVLGIGETTIGLESSQRNGDEGLYVNGRLAFFLRGRIKGKYLLTAQYDSGGSNDDILLQKIDPNKLYPVYGEESGVGSAIPSGGKLYVKLERDNNFLMYGDYETKFDGTLTAYNHKFRGVMGAVHSKYLDVKAFATKARQVVVKDEIRGQGISGFYSLSHKDVVENSIQVSLEVRHRFHLEQVVASYPKKLYYDYDIDFARGLLLFDSPVPSADSEGNPIVIVATYSSREAASEEYIVGVRGKIKPHDKLHVEGTYIYEGQSTGNNEIYGIRTIARPLENVVIEGEMAQTRHFDQTIGDFRIGTGYLATIKGEWGRVKTSLGYHDISLYYHNPFASGIEPGHQKYFAEAQITATEKLQIQMGGYYDISKEEVLRGAGIRTIWKDENSISTMGYEFVEQRKEGEKEYIHIATMGTKLKLSEFFAVRAERHQTLPFDRELSSQPASSGAFTKIEKNVKNDFEAKPNGLAESLGTRLVSKTILGAELAPAGWFSVWVNQEFEDDSQVDLSRTVIGLNLKVTDTTSVYTNYGIENGFSQQRDQALIGLKAEVPLSNWLSGSFFLERVQTFAEADEQDFTAHGINLTMWSFRHRGSFRAEVRHEQRDLKFLITPALTSRWNKYVTTFWRTLYTPNERMDLFQHTTLLGIAYRPRFSDRLNLIGKAQLDWDRDFIKEQLEEVMWAASLDIHFRPVSSVDLMLRYASKYEEIEHLGERENSFTNLIAARWLYQFTDTFDFGFHGGTTRTYETGELDYSYGMELGYRLSSDLWMSMGYNIKGIDDEDLSGNQFLSEGFYVSVRFKFDESSAEKMLPAW